MSNAIDEAENLFVLVILVVVVGLIAFGFFKARSLFSGGAIGTPPGPPVIPGGSGSAPGMPPKLSFTPWSFLKFLTLGLAADEPKGSYQAAPSTSNYDQGPNYSADSMPDLGGAIARFAAYQGIT